MVRAAALVASSCLRRLHLWRPSCRLRLLALTPRQGLLEPYGSRNSVVTKQDRGRARGCPHRSQRIGFCLRAFSTNRPVSPTSDGGAVGWPTPARPHKRATRRWRRAAPWPTRARETPSRTHTHTTHNNHAGGVDPFKEIGSTLEVVEETQLLTKLAKTGLFSKAERAGVKLADLEPLLLFAEENGLVGLLGDLNDELLPLLPLLVSSRL